jgi:hypothetical protein
MTNKVMSKYVLNWMKLQKNEQEENGEVIFDNKELWSSKNEKI